MYAIYLSNLLHTAIGGAERSIKDSIIKYT